MKCTKCALRFLTGLPDNLQQFYIQEQYDLPDDLTDFQPRADGHRWKLDLVKRFVDSGDLLEVGPATGEFAWLARQQGFAPTLIEMNEECVQHLRNKLGMSVLHSNRPDQELAKLGGFDAICVFQTIEHIPHFWTFLNEASKHLRPGGLLMVSTPNPDSLQARILRSRWPHLDVPRHLYLIPRSWLHSFARKHGFVVALDTTRASGDLGLNYYGWYLAVRNLNQRRLGDETVQKIAHWLTDIFRTREESEHAGASYTMGLIKR